MNFRKKERHMYEKHPTRQMELWTKIVHPLRYNLALLEKGEKV